MDHDGVSELAGLAADRLAVDDVVAEELVLGALQLALGDRLGAKLVELGNQRLFDFLGRVSRCHERDREEQVRFFDDVAAAERRYRNLLLVYQRLVDTRAVAVGQNLRRQVERI